MLTSSSDFEIKAIEDHVIMESKAMMNEPFVHRGLHAASITIKEKRWKSFDRRSFQRSGRTFHGRPFTLEKLQLQDTLMIGSGTWLRKSSRLISLRLGEVREKGNDAIMYTKELTRNLNKENQKIVKRIYWHVERRLTGARKEKALEHMQSRTVHIEAQRVQALLRRQCTTSTGGNMDFQRHLPRHAET